MADPAKLSDHALQAEKHLEALATGLADAGADPQMVKGVSSMADACRGIVKSLGKIRDQQPPPQPKEPAQPQPRETMDSATNGLVQDVRAKRAQEG